MEETEAEKLATVSRLQKANDVLELTVRFGGDFKKAAAEYVLAKTVSEAPQAHFHRNQPNSQFFRSREEALVKLAEVMEGNPVLEEAFRAIFDEVAYLAICRHFSNARGFYFLAPFIGGVILNRSEINWQRSTLEELEKGVAREQERLADLNVCRVVVDMYNTEAEAVGSKIHSIRSPASDLWAIIGSHPNWHIFDLITDTVKLGTPGVPGSSGYCCFWYNVHLGNENACAILRTFRKHEPAIKVALAGYLRKWNPEVPEYAKKSVQVVLS